MFFHHFNILMLIAINSGGFKMVSAPMVTANTDFRYPFSSHRALLIGYQSIEIVFVATNINRAALSTVFSYVFLNFRQFFPLTYSLSPLSVRIMYALELTSIRTSFQFWSWRLFIRFTSFHSLSICTSKCLQPTETLKRMMDNYGHTEYVHIVRYTSSSTIANRSIRKCEFCKRIESFAIHSKKISNKWGKIVVFNAKLASTLANSHIWAFCKAQRGKMWMEKNRCISNRNCTV